jgi:hypothetical protein
LMTGKNYSRGEWNNRFPILLFCEEEEKNDHHNNKKKNLQKIGRDATAPESTVGR